MRPDGQTPRGVLSPTKVAALSTQLRPGGGVNITNVPAARIGDTGSVIMSLLCAGLHVLARNPSKGLARDRARTRQLC